MRPIVDDIDANLRPMTALRQLRALVELTKPSITRMVLVTTLCGSAIAPGKIDWPRALYALLGMALVVGSANALNMVLERDSDAMMQRTCGRPIPTGRISATAATWFGILLVAVGLGILAIQVGGTAAWLSAISHVLYVLVYTPLKRITPLALHIGGIPGAMPPVIGWASMTGGTELGAWALFAILFMWQLPHFLAISIFRKQEYARALIRVFPNEEGIDRTKRALALYCIALLGTTLWPYQMGLGGGVYLAICLVLGVTFSSFGLYGLYMKNEAKWARILFFASLPYLVIIYGALVVSAV